MNTLEGKVCLVTGGTSGIGKETVRGLLLCKATVVFTARNSADGEAVSAQFKKEISGAEVSFFVVDLASFVSVRAFALEFKKVYTSLHVLINNAGVMPSQYIETVDGHELNWQVNFLSPLLLIELLLPLLKQGSPSRIVNVSSTMHAQGEIDFNNIENKKDFNHYKAYANSKLALLLLTRQLALELRGSGVVVNALHPGVVETNMLRQGMKRTNPFLRWIFSFKTITPKEGAKTSIFLASSARIAQVTGGYFFKEEQIEPAALAKSDEVALKLLAIARKQILS